MGERSNYGAQIYLMVIKFLGYDQNGNLGPAMGIDPKDPTKTTNDIRNSYGFVPTIEYYPWNDINLKFFVGYVGRVYNYSDYTKNTIGISDNNTGRIMIGLISPLKIL